MYNFVWSISIYTLICSQLRNAMKQILSEKNLVVILFVMVLITFSLAQEDSKKIEKMYSGGTTVTASSILNKADDSKIKESSLNFSAYPSKIAQ